jgi:hypothetical protein
MLILFSNLYIGLLRNIFPSGFPIKNLYTFLWSDL